MRRDASLVPLSHQHHNGLGLCVLTRRALAKDSSAQSILRLARRVIDRYEVELINHFEIEEQVLFPTCGALPLVAALIEEHREMERFVDRLRTAPTAELLEEFCQLLSTHIRREESQLFQQAQDTLSREVLDRVGEEIDRRAVRVCLEPGD